jgi:hypothetical protein
MREARPSYSYSGQVVVAAKLPWIGVTYYEVPGGLFATIRVAPKAVPLQAIERDIPSERSRISVQQEALEQRMHRS